MSNAQAQFGEPWGVLALDLASDQEAMTSLQLVDARFSVALNRQQSSKLEQTAT